MIEGLLEMVAERIELYEVCGVDEFILIGLTSGSASAKAIHSGNYK